MTWINLGDPYPKENPEPYIPFKWEKGDIIRLKMFPESLNLPFSEVLDARMSKRQFGAIDDSQLGIFLWHACRTRGTGASELGFDLEHRASPSAGAIHPIHLLLNRPRDIRWWLYQPRHHELVEIKEAQSKLLGLSAFSKKVLKGDNAICILFLAEPGKTLAKYQHGCSLIWRDTGALISIMALTAAAQGLQFCPLGITGEPWASGLIDQRQLVGVGCALLGSEMKL